MKPFLHSALPCLLILLAQVSAFSQQSCDCRENFEWMQQKIATNYAGYRDKATAQTQPALDALSTQLLAQTEQAADTTCLRLMGEWLRFFRDGHLQIANNAGGSQPEEPKPEDIRARFTAEPSISMTERRAKQLLDQRGEKATPVEGIWQNMDGTYRVVVLPTPLGAEQFRGYSAVILKADSVWWMPSQIKFNLSLAKSGYHEAEYFMRDHSANQHQAFTDGKVLEIKGVGRWRKVYPEAVSDDAVARFPSPYAPPGGVVSTKFELKKLDDQTLLLRIPTFDHNLRHITDSLLAAHADLLARTPNLIIDLRNNGGGSDVSYSKVMPYLYTQPVQVAGTQQFATVDNAEKYRLLQHDKNYPRSTRQYAKRMEKKMLRHPGTLLKGKNSTKKMKIVRPYPQKVAVLINGGCGSSCEQFVLAAKQSKKVTLIGSPTAGVLDYGNMHHMAYSCKKWRLGWATSRSMRIDAGQGLDNVGIVPQLQPDVEVRDWVEFALNYLKKK